MKLLLLALLLWQLDGSAVPYESPQYLEYQRVVTVAPPTSEVGQACVVLDAPVYAHAAVSLRDVRLYQGYREIPYAVTLSESSGPDSESLAVLNRGMRAGRLSFDLAMPSRPYTDVALNLDAKNFLATAQISGFNRPGETPTRLGAFTLFDLSASHLSRDTTLHLQESNFHTLHIEISFSPAPGSPAIALTPAILQRATVLPDREAQTLYTTVAETASITQNGHESTARFRLPAHVPVERVSFELAPEFSGNFSRSVIVTARASDAADAATETITGDILRVHMDREGREVRQQQLSVPAILGANLQSNAVVEVRVNNGNDPPLPLKTIRLEMRQRQLCFSLPLSPHLKLYYGDPELTAPVYDYARLFRASDRFASATLSPEQRNPMYTPRPAPPRSLTERYPQLLWLVLLGVVCVLAVVALHSSKRMQR